MLRDVKALAAIFIIISSIFILPYNVNAEEDLQTLVDAEINVVFNSASDFTINAEMTVNWATAFGESYNKNQIISLSTGTDDDKEALGVIKNNIHNQLRSQLRDIFGEAHVYEKTPKPIINGQIFTEEYTVNLSYLFFNMNDNVNVYDFINGILDIDANISYNFNLIAKHGWNNTYKFVLSDNLNFNNVNTVDITNNNKELTWQVFNGTGNAINKTAELELFKNNPTTSHATKQDIFINFDIDSKNADPVSLNIKINCKTIDIEEYIIFPSFVSGLKYLPADGIRLLVKNNMINWKKIKEKTIEVIKAKVINTIQTPLFNQTLDLVFSWDNTTTDEISTPYEISNMDNNPPVTANLLDENIRLRLNGITAKALFGLVNTGAKATVEPDSINFGRDIENLEYEYNITLHMPEGIELDSNNHYTWNQDKNFTGKIISNLAQKYTNEDINTKIEIETATFDLNLFSFFRGVTELTLGLKANIVKSNKVIKIPDQFSIPENLELEYLTSDAIRLCIEEGVITQNDVNEFLQSEKTIFENILNNVLKGLEIKGNIEKDVFQKSLQWDSDILQMSDEKPVKTSCYSHISCPLKFEVSIVPPSFKIPSQTYNFVGKEGEHVIYRMLFPQGVKVFSSDQNGKSHVNETPDGRQYMEIVFTPSEASSNVDVNVSLEPTIFFIIGLFMPCIISLIITLILIIVIIIFRKKRKREGPMPKYTLEEQSTGYEQEDYYIPPPPGSK
jgi:hypothetical protein